MCVSRSLAIYDYWNKEISLDMLQKIYICNYLLTFLVEYLSNYCFWELQLSYSFVFEGCDPVMAVSFTAIKLLALSC